MSLPENFDSWEHLQSTISKIHNKLVREIFSDQDDNFDINIPRSSLKLANLMNDNETSSMMLIRMLFFLFYSGYAYDNLEPYYGIPVAELQSNIKFKPQLTFYFREDLSDAFENDQRPIRARISKRLTSEQSGTITKTKLINLANKIKTELCTGGGYKFKRGSLDLVYIEPFSIAVDTGEGYEVVVSKRAKDFVGNLLTAQTPLNWRTITDAAKKLEGPLQPARATITNAGTGSTEQTSKITGIKYDQKTGEASYTLPFGKTETKTYAVVMGDIEAALKTPATQNISFQPEIWGKEK